MQGIRLTSAIVLPLLVVAQLSRSAVAGPTTIVDDEIGYGVPIYAGSPYSYTHDITDEPGYSPGFTVISAELELQFQDYYDDPYNNYADEYVTVVYDGTSWNIGEVDSGAYSVNVNPSLLADGRLNVQVSLSSPGFGCGGLL